MNHIITHQNKFEVQIVPTRAQNLEVKNYFCRLDAEALVKTTEILIEDRVIKISDYF